MTKSNSLFRTRLAAKACTYGAVIIGIMGLILIILYVLEERAAFSQGIQANPSLLFSFTIAIFFIAGLTLFFSLTLFALGTLLQYITKEEKVQEEGDEHMEIIALPALHSSREEL